jgi:hypothetical protein
MVMKNILDRPATRTDPSGARVVPANGLLMMSREKTRVEE